MEKSKECKDPVRRIEAHLWFRNFDEYAEREKELSELLKKLHGGVSIVIFFRETPEYLEIPGASYDYEDDEQVEKLLGFCGKDNIDYIIRISRDTEREVGCLRGKQR